MPKAKTPAINFKMYRHFAVVTLAATVLLVVFAEGENGKAEVAGHTVAYDDPATPENDRDGDQQPEQFASSGAATEGTWGNPVSEFGQPMISSGGGSSSVFAKVPGAKTSADKPTARQQEAWDQVERKSLQRAGGTGQSKDR